MKIALDTASYFKNGLEYKKVTSMKIILKIDNLVMKIKDLFKEPALNEVAQQLINQNLYLFMPEIEKSLQGSLGKF